MHLNDWLRDNFRARRKGLLMADLCRTGGSRGATQIAKKNLGYYNCSASSAITGA
jgi:hypothetical protein